MSQSQHPDTPTEPWAAGAPSADAGRDAAERADVEEDRRRQRELDDGELGGEA
jgi:hypothetical protein